MLSLLVASKNEGWRRFMWPTLKYELYVTMESIRYLDCFIPFLFFIFFSSPTFVAAFHITFYGSYFFLSSFPFFSGALLSNSQSG